MPSAKDEIEIVQTIKSYMHEAGQARQLRMTQNDKNFDFYHLRQSYSHKRRGQSQEFLPKQSMAVEQITAFLHQGLVDLGEWFSAEARFGNKNPLLSNNEVERLLLRQLSNAGFYNYVQDALKSGLLGSLMIAKIDGVRVQKPKFFTRRVLADKHSDKRKTQLMKKKESAWQLRLGLVRQRDMFLDPTGEGLYKIQRIEMDMWKLIKMAEENPTIYDVKEVENMRASIMEASLERTRAASEKNQLVTDSNFRHRIVINECWGTILNSEGKVLYENVVCAIANDRFLIRKPEPYPTWMNSDPYVIAPIIRVPNSVYHRALMDAPTEINQALNEIYNLNLDAGIQSVFGIKQLRQDLLEDPAQVSDGIAPGDTLLVTPAVQPGQKVLERVDTGSLSSEGINIFNLTQAEFNQSALTNDLRLGVLPSRAVKATEVVESSQTLTSIFNGIAKSIEEDFIKPILEKSWNMIMMESDDLDSDEVVAILGKTKAEQFSKMPKEERFAKTTNGNQFKVFGITETLNKMKDFRKLTAMLQTISSSDVLTQEFSREFSFSKFLKEIVRALDIDTDRIKLDDIEKQMNDIPMQTSANEQSQIPQAGGENMLTEEPSTELTGT